MKKVAPIPQPANRNIDLRSEFDRIYFLGGVMNPRTK